ncbi:hypothetical protein F0562_018832 [Nyssa sinensis]|uniref:PGG domain-containing protein n=1 Tax=Nyssa sinensis TaxID=561372 RepID=A0A5J4ZE21_9ASTE|nr:hypothetical protein F0562_018832 [Nyssa sinensis]
MPMKRLIRKIDKSGNSKLHMVGSKRNHRMTDKMQSPALQLQEELLLFDQVKEISKTYFVKHYNNDKQTADKLFVVNNDQLHSDTQEWLKRTSENCSIVAVLIATVAFAAAYTISRGSNQSTGFPILQNQPFFEVFTLTDILSLTFTLKSVVKFLSIFTSPYQLKGFKQSLPRKLMLGLTFLVMSVSKIILMINNRERWTKIALYTVALLPVTMFALSYLPLYLSLMKICMYSLKCIGKTFPLCSCFPPSLNSIPKSHITNAPQSNPPDPPVSHASCLLLNPTFPQYESGLMGSHSCSISQSGTH